MARTAYWVVDLASYAVPTNAQIAAGQRTGSVAALKSGSEAFAATTGTGTITEGTAVTGLAAGTQYRLSWTIYDDVALDYPASAPQHYVWTVATVEQDLAATYVVINAAAQDLAGVYAVQGSASQDLAATFAIVNSAQQDLAATYVVINAAAQDLAGAYAVQGSAAQNLSAAYGLAGTVLQDLVGAYDILTAGTVTNDLGAAYTLSNTAAQDLSAAYGTAGTVSQDLAAAYAVVNAAAQDFSAAYAIVNSAQADRAGAYDILASAHQDLTSSWSMAGSISKDLASAYTIYAGGGGGAGAYDVWSYGLSNGQTAEQALVEIRLLVSELHRVHGLRTDSPLVVTPTSRAAGGGIYQTILDNAGAVTVTRQ